MADITDIASEKEQAEIEARLAAHRFNRDNQKELLFCADCEEEIPIERRKLGGKRRCISCQEDHEQRVKAFSK